MKIQYLCCYDIFFKWEENEWDTDDADDADLHMLRCFFEKQETQKENLFKDLAIEQAGPEYKAHQGKYPVIYLTFKDVKYNDWPRCQLKIQRDISLLFKTHKALLNSPELITVSPCLPFFFINLKIKGKSKKCN